MIEPVLYGLTVRACRRCDRVLVFRSSPTMRLRTSTTAAPWSTDSTAWSSRYDIPRHVVTGFALFGFGASGLPISRLVLGSVPAFSLVSRQGSLHVIGLPGTLACAVPYLLRLS